MSSVRSLLLLLLLVVAVPLSAQRSVRQKLSPLARAYALKPQKPLVAFVRGEGDVSALLASHGCTVYATFGDIHIVRIPAPQLTALAGEERITRIELGRLPATTNARTAGIIRADAAHAGTQLPQAYTGKGVVMGIQDIGFDLTNPNFYSRDMSDYRIRALWDMLSLDSDSLLPLGADYRGADALRRYAHSRDGLTESHGSHTLGTAAGSGYTSPYAGIAYDSDICLVCNITTENSELLADVDDDVYGSALTALGFKYIFDYADAVGQPCVISFSEGSYQGFEEEDLLYFDVLDSLVGKGHIIVASAGNNSEDACYIHKAVGQERAGTFMRRYGSELYFMAQGTDDFSVRLTIHGTADEAYTIATAALRAIPDSVVSESITVDGREYEFMYTAYPSCYDDEHLVVECLISGPHRIGYSDVAAVSLEILGAAADVEVYSLLGKFETNTLDPTLADAETSHNVVSPSAAPAVISVGATAYATGYVNMFGDSLVYNCGEDGTRATFSSIGPTLEGRTKPDVMAPGTNIISSTNSYFFAANPDDRQWSDLVGEYTYDGQTYYWKADLGTSMAAPFVGGAIALWLEAKPDLSREEIIDIFAQTCTHPDASLTYPNNLYGYGQIDVYGGLLTILGIDKVEGLKPTLPRAVRLTAGENNTIHVLFATPLTRAAEVKVYSVAGQLLTTAPLAAGTTAATLTVPAATGVVAVQVNGDSAATTGSTLLRLL